MLTKSHIAAFKVLMLIHPLKHPMWKQLEKNKTPILPYSKKQQDFYTNAIRTIDKKLLAETTKSHSFVKSLASASHVTKSIHHTTSSIATLLSQNKQAHCISMLMGTTPMLALVFEKLQKNTSAQKRIHPIRVIRSSGASLSKSQLVTKVKIPHNAITILHDDIVDTGAALLITLLTIRKFRHNTGDTDEGSQASFHKLAPPDLAGSMKRAWDTTVAGPVLLSSIENANKNGKKFTDSEMKPMYKLFAQLLYEENCIVAVPIYKNKPLIQALRNQIKQNPTSYWSTLQSKFLQKILIFKHDDWVMGAGIDTGLRLNTDLKNSIVRIGSTIKNIIVLKKGKDADFFDWVKQELAHAKS